MNSGPIAANLDQADDEILAFKVSDDDLEVAGMGGPVSLGPNSSVGLPPCICF